jgi:hypothetical protein
MKAILNYLIGEKPNYPSQPMMFLKLFLLILLAFTFRPVATVIGFFGAIVFVLVSVSAILLLGETSNED